MSYSEYKEYEYKEYEEYKDYIYIDNEMINISMYNIKSYISKRGINYQNEKGQTLLMIACDYYRHDIVNYLLKNGADVSILDDEKKCCLDYACKTFDKKIVTKIVKYVKKTDVVTKERINNTIYFYSITDDDLDEVDEIDEIDCKE